MKRYLRWIKRYFKGQVGSDGIYEIINVKNGYEEYTLIFNETLLEMARGKRRSLIERVGYSLFLKFFIPKDTRALYSPLTITFKTHIDDIEKWASYWKQELEKAKD